MQLRSFAYGHPVVEIPVIKKTILSTNDISNKRLISKIYKEFTEVNTKKTHNLIFKWAKDMNRHFSKDIHTANRQMKRYSTSLIIGEMQIKTMIRYHLPPSIMAKIKNTRSKRW